MIPADILDLCALAKFDFGGDWRSIEMFFIP